MNRYPPLKGKCAKYIKDNLCLGCNRLELKDFTGDDNCPVIKEQEKNESSFYTNCRFYF